MTGGFVVWCPFPDGEEARRVAATLLDEGLIACANIVPGLVSLYVWNGERGEANEVGMLAKTSELLGPQAITRLEQLHSYRSPAIIGWKADGLGRATHDWLGTLTGTGLA